MLIICMLLLVFFAVIGLCSFITALLDCACREEQDILLLLRGLTEDSAEMRIRHAARLCKKEKSARLICICEQDNPARDICLLMQKEYPFIEINSQKEIKAEFYTKP